MIISPYKASDPVGGYSRRQKGISLLSHYSSINMSLVTEDMQFMLISIVWV